MQPERKLPMQQRMRREPVRNKSLPCGVEIQAFPLSAERIGQLISLIDEGKTNFSIASAQLFPAMLNAADKTPLEIAESLNLLQSNDEALIKALIAEVIAKYPEKVAEYRSGKKGLLGLFVGEVMKLSKGKADPKLTNQLIIAELDAQ